MKNASQSAPPLALAAAQQLEAAHKYKEAERLLRLALTKTPGDSRLAHGLGRNLLAQNRAADALRWCEEAVGCGTDNAQYYETLGDVYQAQEALPKAISAWHTSLYTRPLQEGVLCKLAAAYQAMGDAYAALDYYRQALSVSGHKGPLHYALARCFNDAGLLSDAAEHYQAAAAWMPFHWPLLRDYAENALVLAQYPLCQRILESAHPYFPKEARLWHVQGLLYFRTDHFEEALAAYERALIQEPNNHDMLLDYAVCLRTTGDDGSAEKVLAKVRSLRTC